MTGPSPIPGIGGTGGSCSSDQRLSQEVRPYAVGKPAIKKTQKNVMEMEMVYFWIYHVNLCIWNCLVQISLMYCMLLFSIFVCACGHGHSIVHLHVFHGVDKRDAFHSGQSQIKFKTRIGILEHLLTVGKPTM